MFKKFMLLSILFAFAVFSMAQKPEYVGADGCKACHKKDEKGAQYTKWSETAHAKAFETLKSEKALEVAKKAGLTEAPSESAKCVGCHTTGFGKGGYEIITDAAFWNPAKEDKDAVKAAKRMEGLQTVGCEVCHGAGSEYKGKKAMEGLFAGTVKKEDVGLTDPAEAICIECHNDKSPTFKSFNFAEYIEKVKHPFPEGMRK